MESIFCTGSPCKKCGNTIRYANGRSCVQCVKSNSHARWLSRKKGSTAIFYDGTACKHCKGTRRYFKSGHCVVCSKRRARDLILNYKPSEEDRQLAISLYNEGFGIPEIRAKFYCSANQIREYLGLPLWQKPSTSQPFSPSQDASPSDLLSLLKAS